MKIFYILDKNEKHPENHNLTDIFISLEIIKIEPNYVNPYKIAINKLIKLIEGDNINNILKIYTNRAI